MARKSCVPFVKGSAGLLLLPLFLLIPACLRHLLSQQVQAGEQSTLVNGGEMQSRPEGLPFQHGLLGQRGHPTRSPVDGYVTDTPTPVLLELDFGVSLSQQLNLNLTHVSL